MTEEIILLEDVSLSFPLIGVRKGRKPSEVKKVDSPGSESGKQSYVVDFGSTKICWEELSAAYCYRFLVRNFTTNEIEMKPILFDAEFMLNWSKLPSGFDYRYRVQYKLSADGEWEDLEKYEKLTPPKEKKIFIDDREEGVRDNREFKAIDSVSLRIKRGEVIGIVGKNGSGKSTLLRLIGGIYAPDSGKIVTGGRVTLLVSLGAGFETHLTGRENVMLTGLIYGLERAELDELMPSIIEFSGIESRFIDQPLRTYSSGMRSRLGFSIVSHLEPEILLLDEVMGTGDYEFKKKSQERILEMVNGNSTAIVVSHDTSLLGRICNRVFAMDGGKIVTNGEVSSAISVYESA